MPWIDRFDFGEQFVDLRNPKGTRRAEALLAELGRELTPGHPLHGREVRVVAEALPQDEIVVAAGEHVALVHLTWSAREEATPWPATEFVEAADAFADLVEYRY